MTQAVGAGRINTWRAWLAADIPQTRRQAQAQEAYRIVRALAANPLTLSGALIVLALIVLSVLAPVLTIHSPLETDLTNRLQPSSAAHWLGTDDLGRDIFSRILHGTQLTLYIVVLVAITAAPAGLLIGATAGFLGGLTETILMRITDIFLAFPKLILALAFVAAMGAGLNSAILAIALTSWPPIARIARAEALVIRQSDFIAAVRLMGASNARIILRHVMPLCMPSVIVRITLDMAGIILIAAGLGFLGLGAQPPAPEWGAMVSKGREFLTDQWWVATYPGIAIFIVSMGFNLLGDGLRDVLDPREQAR